MSMTWNVSLFNASPAAQASRSSCGRKVCLACDVDGAQRGLHRHETVEEPENAQA
jgi:hypothetical protein